MSIMFLRKRPDYLINIGCLEPIKASEGSRIKYYPCGKCIACQIKKANNNAQQTWFEFNGIKQYPLFVLLTYDNQNLPMCVCDYVLTNNKTRSGMQLYNVTITDVLDGVVMFDSEMPEYQLKQLYRHARKENNGISIPPFDKRGGNFQFSRVRQYDLQLFHKRLRRQIEKKGLHSYRFGACSEYGPTTNRPHYHVILFCRDAVERYQIYKLIDKCWRLGFTSTKLYAGHGCDYISSYITSAESISPLHQRIPELRPKFTHSIYYGFAGCAKFNGTLSKMLDEPREFLQSVCTPCDGKLKELFPLVQYYRSCLPKLPRHDVIFTGSRRKVVHGTIKPEIMALTKAYLAPYFYAERYYGVTNVNIAIVDTIMNLFVSDVNEYFKELSVKEIGAEDIIPQLCEELALQPITQPQKAFISYYILQIASDILGKVDCKALYQRVMRAIHVCKKHLHNLVEYYNLCDNGDITYLGMYYYMSRVQEFYSALDAQMLHSQLDKLERGALQYGWIKVGVHLYDNLQEHLETLQGEYWLEPELEKKSSLYYANLDYLQQQAKERSKTKKVKEHYTLKTRNVGIKAYGSNREFK